MIIMSETIDKTRKSVVSQVQYLAEQPLGYDITFQFNPQLLKDLELFTQHETKCCSFLNFVNRPTRTRT